MTTLFPAPFLFGAATSAYQVEGSPLADGAGPSNWHRFAHEPGRTANGDTGDVACDHYRRFGGDVALMKELGLTAYRFSISWSRVLPGGTGRVNEKGLDFYRRLLDALADAGIAPMATLFHWDLPQALEEKGGWLHRDAAAWMGEYAAAAARALKGGVALWATLNEPWVVVDAGYLRGILAPGHASRAEAPAAAHNLLRAHAEAVRAVRAEGGAPVGIVVNLEPKHPASARAEDLAAAARAEAYMNRWFLDPILLGRYPEELPGIFGAAWPAFPASDLARIATPVDFVGVNYYTRSVVRDEPEGLPPRAERVRQEGAEHTEMGWEVYPAGLLEILTWVKERYGPVPLHVTENGAAFADPEAAPPEGIRDERRAAYLAAHLRAAREAIARGVDLRGYFAWSLLDNFEWAHGFSKRFGIVHVNYRTQARTPKESARLLSRVIATRGAALG